MNIARSIRKCISHFARCCQVHTIGVQPFSHSHQQYCWVSYFLQFHPKSIVFFFFFILPILFRENMVFHHSFNLYCYYYERLSLVAQTIKRLSTMPETRVRSLGWEDPLEKEMAIHSRTIAWKISWTEEPGRRYSPGGRKETDTTERLHYYVHIVMLTRISSTFLLLKTHSLLNLSFCILFFWCLSTFWVFTVCHFHWCKHFMLRIFY